MHNCNDVEVYNSLVKKINEIINELNNLNLHKLESQRILNKCFELKNEIEKDSYLILQNVQKNVDIIIQSAKLIDILNTELENSRITEEQEGVYFSLINALNGYLRLNKITGNTLVNLAIEPANNGFINNQYAIVSRTIYNLKPSTLYTYIITNNSSEVVQLYLNNSQCFSYKHIDVKANSTVKGTATTLDTISGTVWISLEQAETVEQNLKLILLEGDYTNKPIPNYFTGMKSSFEDKVVTQEMVDSGEELAENLGKYRVDYKVTGKNLYDVNKLVIGYTIGIDGSLSTTSNLNLATIKLDVTNMQGKALIKSGGNSAYYRIEDSSGNKITYGNDISITIPIGSKTLYWYVSTDKTLQVQIEEGSTATAYEPYKEFTKTYYLNSPLLKGDTLEMIDGKLNHVHRSEIVAYTEGDESNYITDLTNTLKTKTSPTYEIIEGNLTEVNESYKKMSIEFNTDIPVTLNLTYTGTNDTTSVSLLESDYLGTDLNDTLNKENEDPIIVENDSNEIINNEEEL